MRRTVGRILLLQLVLVFAFPASPSETAKVLWSRTSFGASDYFQEPSDIEIDHGRSLIYVVDAGSNRVLVFDFEGEYLRAIGRKGQGPGEFARATGACLVPGGGLAVADFGGNRIELFDIAGKLVRSVNVTETKVADLVESEGRFYTVPAFGQSGHVVAMGSEAKFQPLVNVLDDQGKRVLEISVDDFPETQPFVRAIKHRVCLAVSSRGKLFLPYFAADLVQVFEKTGQKVGEFRRPLAFKPVTPALVGQRSPEKEVVQMWAKLDFVSLAAEFSPDGQLYILTVTESLDEIRKDDPDLKNPLPMRLDVIDPETYQVVRTIACDPGIKAFGLMGSGRVVYVCEDMEGELALKCVRF